MVRLYYMTPATAFSICLPRQGCDPAGKAVRVFLYQLDKFVIGYPVKLNSYRGGAMATNETHWYMIVE